MKATNFKFLHAFLIAGIIILAALLWGCVSTPKHDPLAQKVLEMTSEQQLDYVIHIHKLYLNKPESKATGSHEWHRAWVWVYEGWKDKKGE